MKFLALDTATEACSVALWHDGQVYHLDEVCPQQHSKRILPMVQQLLSDAGVPLRQLDGIVFGRGPGSFTGVRIGVGVVQGLAFGADLPVFGVSTLQAMAQAAYRLHQASDVVAAIDARMGEVYIAQYQLCNDRAASAYGLMQAVSAEQALKPAQLPPLLVSSKATAVGTGLQTYRDAFAAWQAELTVSSAVLLPSAQDMLPFANDAYAKGLFVAPELAEPVYVRDEVTWQKLPGR